MGIWPKPVCWSAHNQIPMIFTCQYPNVWGKVILLGPLGTYVWNGASTLQKRKGIGCFCCWQIPFSLRLDPQEKLWRKDLWQDHRENGGCFVGMVPIYILYSGYLLGISPFRAPWGQLGGTIPTSPPLSLWPYDKMFRRSECFFPGEKLRHKKTTYTRDVCYDATKKMVSFTISRIFWVKKTVHADPIFSRKSGMVCPGECSQIGIDL